MFEPEPYNNNNEGIRGPTSRGYTGVTEKETCRPTSASICLFLKVPPFCLLNQLNGPHVSPMLTCRSSPSGRRCWHFMFLQLMGTTCTINILMPDLLSQCVKQFHKQGRDEMRDRFPTACIKTGSEKRPFNHEWPNCYMFFLPGLKTGYHNAKLWNWLHVMLQWEGWNHSSQYEYKNSEFILKWIIQFDIWNFLDIFLRNFSL